MRLPGSTSPQVRDTPLMWHRGTGNMLVYDCQCVGALAERTSRTRDWL